MIDPDERDVPMWASDDLPTDGALDREYGIGVHREAAPAVMTKTEARRRAKLHLQFGYYNPPGRAVYVTCPVCRGRVERELVAWASPADKSRALVEALTEHLREEHPDA